MKLRTQRYKLICYTNSEVDAVKKRITVIIVIFLLSVFVYFLRTGYYSEDLVCFVNLQDVPQNTHYVELSVPQSNISDGYVDYNFEQGERNSIDDSEKVLSESGIESAQITFNKDSKANKQICFAFVDEDGNILDYSEQVKLLRFFEVTSIDIGQQNVKVHYNYFNKNAVLILFAFVFIFELIKIIKELVKIQNKANHKK